ncbi:MAG: hypothetical protein RMN51_13080 [Verrucomicrobiota bacterium]|nr:hypothetical protein [Limisphaera sp.]MDW8383028.1 hypothetical protein [Verrucomicrobiota bacterium]
MRPMLGTSGVTGPGRSMQVTFGRPTMTLTRPRVPQAGHAGWPLSFRWQPGAILYEPALLKRRRLLIPWPRCLTSLALSLTGWIVIS